MPKQPDGPDDGRSAIAPNPCTKDNTMSHLINVGVMSSHNPAVKLYASGGGGYPSLAYDLSDAFGLDPFTLEEQHPCWESEDGRVFMPLLQGHVLAWAAYGPGAQTVAIVTTTDGHAQFAVHLDGDPDKTMQMFTVAVRTAPECCEFSRLHADGDVLSILWESEPEPVSIAHKAWFDQEGRVVRHFVRDEDGAAESPWPGIPARRLAERVAPSFA